MPAQSAVQGDGWPVQAVRDTVAEIAQQALYQRSAGESIWDRVSRAFWELLGRLLDAATDSATGRAVTIVVLIALAVLAVLRFFIASRAAIDDARLGSARGGGRSSTLDPWHDAQQLAARGEFTEAAHALFAALLIALAARGDVRLHSSKTAGDYARELARKGSGATNGFNLFRRRYDTVIYGYGVCDAGQYAALLSDAQPLLAGPGSA